MRRLAILELNEVPLSVFQWHAVRHPESAVAQLLERSAVGESLAEEDLPREPYPSQSWASLSTGVPFLDHGIFWYGDPKPDAYPMYWQAAARAGVSTGLVGTLHSSPLHDQCESPSFRFVLPDAFAANSDALPGSLRGLQDFNLAMTRSNSRAVADPAPWRKYLGAVGGLLRARVSPSTVSLLSRLAFDVGTGRVRKERLRAGQFHLAADQFTRLSEKHDPDLAVFFSNHVASAMHRYWFANFPQDWETKIYDEEWVARFADEIPYAMRSLDRWLERWMRWVEQTDRTLLVVSSMGQRGGSEVDSSVVTALNLAKPKVLADALGLSGSYTVGHAMVPQVTYTFDSADDASHAAARITNLDLVGIKFGVDQRDGSVTLSYQVEQNVPAVVCIDGVSFTPEQIGFTVVPVEEHRAAVHDPRGSVIVFNSPSAKLPSDPFSYFELAPAILAALGVPALAHHRKPTVCL